MGPVFVASLGGISFLDESVCLGYGSYRGGLLLVDKGSLDRYDFYGKETDEIGWRRS